MNQFSGDIASILEIALFASGMVVLHFGNAHKAILLKVAGWIMMIGGVVGILCTSHFWLKYYYQGDFDVANKVQQARPLDMSKSGGAH